MFLCFVISMKKIFLVLGLILIGAASAMAMSTPRWSYFPLNIYIEQGNRGSATVQRAFETWQANSAAILKFFYRTTGPFAKTAQIRVTFTDDIPAEKPYRIVRQNATGYYAQGFFIHLDIQFRKTDENGKPISQTKLYSAALQAVGGAMGVNCLNSKDAVMSCNADYTKTVLTQDDVEALVSVYKYDKNKNVYRMRY